MSKARTRIPERLNHLTRSEWDRLLQQAPLGIEDGYIARRCLVDRVAQIEIAEELGDVAGVSYSRSTISRRMPRIMGKIERTAERIGMM